jgi:hypothetical protein
MKKNNIIKKFFNLSTMGHWWIMILSAVLFAPIILVWPGFEETLLGGIIFFIGGIIILLNFVLLIYKFIKEVAKDESEENLIKDKKTGKKIKKRMTPGAVFIMSFFLILMSMFWLLITYNLLKFFSGNYTFEEKVFENFTVSAEYMPFVVGLMWLGASFFIKDTLGEIIKWFKENKKN